MKQRRVESHCEKSSLPSSSDDMHHRKHLRRGSNSCQKHPTRSQIRFLISSFLVFGAVLWALKAIHHVSPSSMKRHYGAVDVKRRGPYHSWGPEGINFDLLVNAMNETLDVPQTFMKVNENGRLEFFNRPDAPLLIICAIQDQLPSLWVPRKAVEFRYVYDNRLRNHLPHLQEALQVQLWEGRTQYPALIKALQQVGSIPMLWDLSDYRGCPNNRQKSRRQKAPYMVPFFATCQSVDCNYGFPMPNYKVYEYALLGDRNGKNVWDETMQQWEKQYPWAEKQKKAYWRGGCKNQRRKFTTIAQSNTSFDDFLDVRVGCGNDMRLPSAPGAAEDSMKFKIAFDIDGASWSERFPRLLCYNSAVIRVAHDDDYEDYFVGDLQPGVHYLVADLDNFTSATYEALQDDALLKRLVHNANTWCRERLTIRQLNWDFLSILNGYVEALDRGHPDWMKQWRSGASGLVGIERKEDGHHGFSNASIDVNDLSKFETWEKTI